jgi:hypothetical protein
MADSSLTDEPNTHDSRQVLYQVSLDIALVAINHQAIQVALPPLADVFRAGLSLILGMRLVAWAALGGNKT